MKRKLILIFMVLIFITFISAVPVEKNDAREIANNFMKMKKQTENVDIIKSFTREANGETIYHVFNYRDGGFVILSGDDRVKPVIGYSTKHFAPKEIKNPAAKEWMDMVVDKIREAKRIKLEPSTEVKERWNRLKNYGGPKDEPAMSFGTPVVSPLLDGSNGSSYEDDILWDQSDTYSLGTPYNYYSPVDDNSTGGTGKAPVGCVATALAQIFKYWEYPNRPMGVHAYMNVGLGPDNPSDPELIDTKIFEDVINTSDNDVYDWEYVLPNLFYVYWSEADQSWYYNYPSGVTENNWKEASQIGYDIGVAVNMAYSSTASGAYTFMIPDVIKKYFNYADTVDYENRSEYSDANWISLLKNELDNDRPVEYKGSATDGSGGHAFVCDGYDTDDYFHFNWGWAGYLNGYFDIDDLTPGSSGSDFSYNQGAVIGIQPWSELGKAAPPVAEYQSGTYPVTQLSQINLYQDNGDTIQYSISYDGSDPGTPSTTYSSPISLSSGDHVRIKVQTTGVTGLTDSDIREFEYYIVGQSDIANPLDDSFGGSWTTGGISPYSWTVDGSDYQAGSSSLKTPDLTGGVTVYTDSPSGYSQYQSAYIKKTATVNSGNVTFDWKSATDDSYEGDKIIFFIDGEKKAEIDGSQSWSSESFSVSSGTHEFVWLFQTDFYTSSPPNVGWVDNVGLPGISSFSITSDATTVSLYGNTTVQWESAGAGATYQIQYKIGSGETYTDIGATVTDPTTEQTISCNNPGEWYVRVEATGSSQTIPSDNEDQFYVTSVGDIDVDVSDNDTPVIGDVIFTDPFIDINDNIDIRWDDTNDTSSYTYSWAVTPAGNTPGSYQAIDPNNINHDTQNNKYFIIDQVTGFSTPGEYTLHLKCANSGNPANDYAVFTKNFHLREVFSGILPDLLNDKYLKVIGMIDGNDTNDVDLVKVTVNSTDYEVTGSSDGNFVSGSTFNTEEFDTSTSIEVVVDDETYNTINKYFANVTNNLEEVISNIKLSGDSDEIYYIPVKDQMNRLPDIDGNIYFIGDIDSDIYYDAGANKVMKKLIGNNWSTVNKIDSTGYYALTSGTVPKIENNSIKQNFPNPFNPETTIPITVKEPGKVKLMVYSANGKHVKTLVNEHYSTARENVNIKWDGKDKNGDVVSSGIYYAILSVNGKKCVRKMVLLK